MEVKPVDEKRRNFLKVLALGGGLAVLGKIFGGSVLDLFYGPPVTKEFSQFNVEESRKKFVISDKSGEEIFVMDNEK